MVNEYTLPSEKDKQNRKSDLLPTIHPPLPKSPQTPNPTERSVAPDPRTISNRPLPPPLSFSQPTSPLSNTFKAQAIKTLTTHFQVSCEIYLSKYPWTMVDPDINYSLTASTPLPPLLARRVGRLADRDMVMGRIGRYGLRI